MIAWFIFLKHKRFEFLSSVKFSNEISFVVNYFKMLDFCLLSLYLALIKILAEFKKFF